MTAMMTAAIRLRWPIAAGAVGLMIMVSLAFVGIGTLHGRRAILDAFARSAAATRAPVGGLLPGGGYRDRARKAAAAAFARRLLQAAADRRLLVETIEIMPSRPDSTAELVAHVTLSGREGDILGYATAIERARPLARFTAWRLAPAAAGDGAVRLDATAMSLWQGA